VVKLAFLILPHLKDERVQALSHPANRTVLLRQIRALIEVVGPVKYPLRLFKADPTAGILPQSLAFARIEVKTHMYNSYTVARKNASGKRVVSALPCGVGKGVRRYMLY
jgi:hypothetical protein